MHIQKESIESNIHKNKNELQRTKDKKRLEESCKRKMHYTWLQN